MKNETDLAMMINNQTYTDFLDRLRLVATSLFTWEGLDDECGFGASRFLEQALFDFGKGVVIKDSELGFMALKVIPSDKLNVYNLPEKITAFSIGYSREFNFDECIYIMNNELQLPTAKTLQLMAYRLYDTQRVLDTNLNAHRTPVLIEGDSKTILTLKNVYMQYQGNIPFVFGNKQFDISNKLNVLKTDAPYLIDKLELEKHEIFNEALTFLGINNANTDKKERLITDEVNSNNELINYYLNCFYKTRKDACNRMNEKYGWNIKIKLNNEVTDLINVNSNDIINYEKDGDSNGEIYNNNKESNQE